MVSTPMIATMISCGTPYFCSARRRVFGYLFQNSSPSLTRLRFTKIARYSSHGLYAARANLKPVLITAMALGGKLMPTTDVDNWPADPNGVQGPELMQRFQQHAERFNTQIIFDHIHTAKLQQKPL